jgi:hypothetical protein
MYMCIKSVFIVCVAKRLEFKVTTYITLLLRATFLVVQGGGYPPEFPVLTSK